MQLEYIVTTEEGLKTLYINAQNYPKLPTIEDNPEIMAYVIETLLKEPDVDQIVIDQIDQYVYYPETVRILRQLAEIYYKYKFQLSSSMIFRIKQDILAPEIRKITESIIRDYPFDPAHSYIKIRRIYRKLSYLKSKTSDSKISEAIGNILQFLNSFLSDFENTIFYRTVKDFLLGYRGDRSIYSRVIYSDIKPSFIYTRISRSIPRDWDIIDSYKLDKDIEVFILSKPGEAIYRYHLLPPELFLKDEEYMILVKAREILSSYTPRKEEYVYLENLKEKLRIPALSLIRNLAQKMNLEISGDRTNTLVDILLRHLIGFGVLEVLLRDENIQDILINSPIGSSPVYVYHAHYETCATNIYITPKEGESWATKLRLISGRPFDEANPVLDTELELGEIRARVSAITHPLSPTGLAFAFRRHREKPWTLPLFIKNKMLNSLAAGLLSFLVFGGRSILICGTRGAGKTSLLTALMLEIPRKIRIITVEDTLELPVAKLRRLGYNIQSLKVRSPVSIQTNEPSPEQGVRVSLRLGDSALIIGEVRSKEALVLYEAMRVGAAANVVMGTIHADSPYGVYDRVVNDLGVPKTSFKATDVIVVANPIRDPSGLRKYRRVLKITEVRKHWEEDPLKEKGFVDIMNYDIGKDTLVPTLEFIHGDIEVLKALASKIKVFAGSWDRVWNHIVLRGKIKELLVKYASITGKSSILEAEFVVAANEKFLSIMHDVYNELGYPEEKEVYERFEKWLKSTIKQSPI